MPQAKRKRNIWLKTNDVVAHTGDLVPYLTIDGNTELAVSASQSVKAIYKPRDQVSRQVDFITGVKVGGSIDKIDIGIAIHAPYDTGRSGYYNIPRFWRDGMTLNFGIGYPF